MYSVFLQIYDSIPPSQRGRRREENKIIITQHYHNPFLTNFLSLSAQRVQLDHFIRRSDCDAKKAHDDLGSER